ncbi:MAG TPA: sensor histidine kinase KdpD [Candidatus Sulfotelmatobacter sp.]|nr:sensor histidine kinase KdpD [Candidatus Sulfotelmatobacter sp.]
MPEAENAPLGKLKVYLGYAAGVGKTFQMLADGQTAAQRGLDVVLAYFEPHARPDTIAQVQGLEIQPYRKINYRDRTFEEMDTEALLRRKPQIALVDELAHMNVPGSGRTKRWEDVQVLLHAGIEVWTTMNVQHIESLNDQIWRITGIQVRETVPDWVIRQAAELVAVDVTPEALLNRLKRGAIYKPEMVQKALQGFFKGSNLGALRELTLRQAAHEVDLQQSAYDETSNVQAPRTSETSPAGKADNPWKERILIHITADPSTAILIRRGRRVADYLHADCMALFVHRTTEVSQLPASEREAVEKHLRFARGLQIETLVVGGSDVARTVVEFARHNQVTQIFVAQSQTRLGERLRSRNFAENIVRMAEDLQVTVVADRSRRLRS